ncbi:oxidoreductase [Streptomyces camponoticapitis]|uniref:Oxidoreductase n=1 Tax=Streptomyces camponoticapitis TaxID=1616125 RepID=A0ABQ2ECD8_9ACTN|nr:FAD-binding oxidoreductase [Streptomyces camponoticapitis]GGK06334.1 oxidoreductase [Streptomyces camponoticapitis]
MSTDTDPRLGLNRAVESRPAQVVEAAGEREVVAAVGLAARRKRAVGVMATGHGPSLSADGAVLVNTRRMDGVRVDPARGTAWIEAGARWRHVLARTTPHGLAPLNGSSPDVGAVGYLVGGGAGLLGRRYGFAADHVRRLRLVTADGRLREVTADAEPDLFWAVRGGKDNFGLVVGMEVDLFPVARLYGGGLYFPGEASAEVLHAYADWVRSVPETMASSVLLVRNPDLPDVPEPLRGRFVTHLRIAHSGDPAEGERLVRPLRGLGPVLLDTVRKMPYADVGTIHHEPTSAPYVAHDRGLLLGELTGGTVDALVALAGPDAGGTFVTELRHFGGAYARPPKVPNCVGGRDAAFSLFTGAVPDPETLRRRDGLLTGLRPWSTGGITLNFAGVEDTAPDRVRAAYTPADFDRLRTLKSRHDPGNMFRINFNIPPKEGA